MNIKNTEKLIEILNMIVFDFLDTYIVEKRKD